MSTFNLIIKKIVKLDNNIFSYNYNETDGISGIHKIFFYILYKLESKNNNTSKFIFLDETLNNYYFCEKELEKKEFLNLFNKIQKIYYIINHVGSSFHGSCWKRKTF